MFISSIFWCRKKLKLFTTFCNLVGNISAGVDDKDWLPHFVTGGLLQSRDAHFVMQNWKSTNAG